MQTGLPEVAPGKYVCVLSDAKSINHVVVFLTGQQAFPSGIGATVHFGWPGPDGAVGWQYLGYLSNDKPSAVFRVSAYKAAIALEESSMIDGTISAHIGIAIEPMTAVEATAAAAAAANSRSIIQRPDTTAPPAAAPVEPADVARRVALHFYNYLASFLGTPAYATLLQIAQGWYQSVDQRLRTDPDFWKRDPS